jgi:hypothetical protein
MKKILFACVAVLAVVVVVGCARAGSLGEMLAQESVANSNNRALGALRIGMTDRDVLKQMGGADRTEVFRGQDGTIVTVIYYATAANDGYALKDGHFTPVVFVNGLLEGWGFIVYDAVAHRYDGRVVSSVRVRGER